MKHLPAKTKQSQIAIADTQVERLENPATFHPFFNFSYSHQEMRISRDGQTHIKQKNVRLENGRIESEAFEGYAPAAVFEKTMKDTQQLFAEQATWFLKQFSLFPLLPGTRSDDDTR